MTLETKPGARDRLLEAGIRLIRLNGYSATSVGQICEAAGVSKGAFFHHFASKEALAEACLAYWDGMVEHAEAQAQFSQEADPLKRLTGYMDHYIAIFGRPDIIKSCLVGTTVQEVAESNAGLRNAAQACFDHVEERFRAILDAAAEHQGVKLDATSLANLWFAAMQGALILAKASGDEAVIPASLKHVRSYICGAMGITEPG